MVPEGLPVIKGTLKALGMNACDAVIQSLTGIRPKIQPAIFIQDVCFHAIQKADACSFLGRHFQASEIRLLTGTRRGRAMIRNAKAKHMPFCSGLGQVRDGVHASMSACHGMNVQIHGQELFQEKICQGSITL